MKTKIAVILVLMAWGCMPQASGQEMTAQDFIDEANNNLKSQNFKEAITSLNMAINEINKMLIHEIRITLPEEVNGYKAQPDNDETNGSAAMGLFGGGLSVERTYYHDREQAEDYFSVAVMGNSPLLASVNMMLSNSMYMSGTGNKIIRLGNKKAMLSDERNGSFKLQLPLSSSLISVEGYGFSSADSFMEIINKINFSQIAEVLSE